MQAQAHEDEKETNKESRHPAVNQIVVPRVLTGVGNKCVAGETVIGNSVETSQTQPNVAFVAVVESQ